MVKQHDNQKLKISKASSKDALKKGGVKMKTTATIKIAVLTLAILAVICTPLMTLTVHAQAHSSYTGAYHAIAYLAEQEIKANELTAQADKKVTLTAKAHVANDQNDYESGTEQRVPADKEKVTR